MTIRVVAVPKEHLAQGSKDVALFREAAQRRGKAEKQLLIQGSSLTNTHPVKVELPKAPVPSGKARVQAPPPPVASKHEVQSILKHESPPPPQPAPKKDKGHKR